MLSMNMHFRNTYNYQNTNVHVQTWCTMHTAQEYFCRGKPNNRTSHSYVVLHNTIITIKTKTNMIAVATTDGISTRYGRPTRTESEIII